MASRRITKMGAQSVCRSEGDGEVRFIVPNKWPNGIRMH